MSWFVVEEKMSEKAQKVLTRLANQGSSEAAAVAECLNTIASNGDGLETDEYLIGCAQELCGCATAFIVQMREKGIPNGDGTTPGGPTQTSEV